MNEAKGLKRARTCDVTFCLGEMGEHGVCHAHVWHATVSKSARTDTERTREEICLATAGFTTMHSGLSCQLHGLV